MTASTIIPDASRLVLGCANRREVLCFPLGSYDDSDNYGRAGKRPPRLHMILSDLFSSLVDSHCSSTKNPLNLQSWADLGHWGVRWSGRHTRTSQISYSMMTSSAVCSKHLGSVVVTNIPGRERIKANQPNRVGIYFKRWLDQTLQSSFWPLWWKQIGKEASESRFCSSRIHPRVRNRVPLHAELHVQLSLANVYPWWKTRFVWSHPPHLGCWGWLRVTFANHCSFVNGNWRRPMTFALMSCTNSHWSWSSCQAIRICSKGIQFGLRCSWISARPLLSSWFNPSNTGS